MSQLTVRGKTGANTPNSTHETDNPDKCSTDTTGIPNSNYGDKPMVIDNINNKINCFIPGPTKRR